MSCYFGAESCAKGHTADCPMRNGAPWPAVALDPTCPQSIYDGSAALAGECIGPDGEKWYYSSAEKRWIIED